MVLKIENFQRIKNQTLEVKGFTVIKGETSLGKSSVRRVVESLVLGGWKKEYIRLGEKRTCLSLKTKSLEVSLNKTATSGGYEVNGKDLPKGGSYPQEIRDLNFDPTLNITTLYSPLFILGESSSVVTERINKITGISVYEKVNKKIKSRNIKLTVSLKLQEESLNKEVSHLDNLLYLKSKIEPLERLRGAVEVLEVYHKALTSSQKQEETLKRVEEGARLITELEELEIALYHDKLVQKTTNLLKNVEEAQQKRAELEALLNHKYHKELLERVEVLEGKLSQTLEGVKNQISLIEHREVMEKLKRLKERQVKSLEVLEEINAKLESHKCPTCKQYLGDSHENPTH